MRALLLGMLALAAHAELQERYQYCVVGAGPGGLQLGHYMNRAGRDYIIFERAATAGYFYHLYPTHRKLISLNKRFTGRDNKDFNLRHDWNSLLDHDDVSLMTQRTPDRFPPADVLTEYLKEFATEQERDQKIRYNTSVERIDRDQPSADFSVKIASEGKTSVVTCGVVVMATGLWVPNKGGSTPSQQIPGIENTIGYEEIPSTGESFEGQTVAVLGLGNAALETADALAPYVNYVHILNPGNNIPKPSWESRYPGNPRAVNAGAFDAYLLKSLDGGFKPLKISLHPCSYTTRDRANPTLEDIGRIQREPKDGKASRICIFPLGPDAFTGEDVGPGLVTIPVADKTIKSGWGKAAIEALKNVSQLQPSVVPSKAELYKVYRDRAVPLFMTSVMEHVLQIHPDNVTTDNVDTLMRLAAYTGTPFPLVYDKVIRCLGWKHNSTTYGDGAVPLMQSNSKYAVMNPKYESVNVPNLYFAGTLSHGKDVKRSAGAFIHGFRYTARALHRILELEHHKVAWPSKTFSCDEAGIDGLVEHTLHRINTASGPYQMIGSLGDAIVLHPNGTLQYLYEMPIPLFHQLYSGLPRIHWSFAYWKQRQSLYESISEGTYFEIHMWYHGATKSKRRLHSRDMLRLIEAFHTDWDNEYTRDNIRLFIANKAAAAAAGSCSAEVQELGEKFQLSLEADRTHKSEAAGGEKGSSQFELSSWTAGEVDLWVYNQRSFPIAMVRNKEQMEVLEPGRGKTFTAYDGDTWKAVKFPGGREIMSHLVDLGMGKVQDMYVSASNSNSCSPANGQKCSKDEEDNDTEAALASEEKPDAKTKCQHLKQELARANKMAEKLLQGQEHLQEAQKKMGCV